MEMDRSGTELQHVVKIVRVWNVPDAAAENSYSIFPKDLCEKWLAKLKESETLLPVALAAAPKADKKGSKRSFDHTGSGSGAVSGTSGSITDAAVPSSQPKTYVAAESVAGNSSTTAGGSAAGGVWGAKRQHTTAKIYAIAVRESPTHPPQFQSDRGRIVPIRNAMHIVHDLEVAVQGVQEAVQAIDDRLTGIEALLTLILNHLGIPNPSGNANLNV